MTWAIALKVLKKALPHLIVLGLLFGLYQCGISRGKAKATLAAAKEVAELKQDQSEELAKKDATIAERDATIVARDTTIREQNGLIEEAARLGELAQRHQRTIDALTAKLALAEFDLRVISDKYKHMQEQAVGLDVCQTYELVLRSMAGGAP